MKQYRIIAHIYAPLDHQNIMNHQDYYYSRKDFLNAINIACKEGWSINGDLIVLPKGADNYACIMQRLEKEFPDE